MSGYPCCGGQTDIGHMLDCAAHRQANAAMRQARAIERMATPAVDQTKLLASVSLQLQDLVDAIRDYIGGIDLFEGCTKVRQTYAGDYDCDGCEHCGLYHEMVAAEELIEKVDASLEIDSRSRADVPIPPA